VAIFPVKPITYLPGQALILPPIIILAALMQNVKGYCENIRKGVDI
jgi:hypothetical protein